jgi:hypothetical protein
VEERRSWRTPIRVGELHSSDSHSHAVPGTDRAANLAGWSSEPAALRESAVLRDDPRFAAWLGTGIAVLARRLARYSRQEKERMRQQLRRLTLVASSWTLILAAPGCGGDSTGGTMGGGDFGDPDIVVGQWCVIEIEGAAPPFDLPQQPCAVSTWTFNADGSYQWFLHASPFFVLDGAGTYSLSGSALTVSGIIADTLFSSTPGNLDVVPLEITSPELFRFRDEDQDRWTYQKQ